MAEQTTGAERPSVVVLDYGSGNVHSAVKALQAAGANVELTSDADAVFRADGLLVPGVGAFAAVIDQLENVDGAHLIQRRLDAGKPVLGICVGLQIMFTTGTEHGIRREGIGLMPGTVTELDAKVLPHMGWNTVQAPADSELFSGIADERFYFVHSYGVEDDPAQQGASEAKITWAEHEGARFVAAFEHGPLTATQFHPEKSGRAGLQLLHNWITSLSPDAKR